MVSARARYGYLAVVALAILLLDQVTKAAIREWLHFGGSIPLVPPALYLTHTTNRGVAFGLFSRFGDAFILVAALIMTAIFLYYRSLRGRRLLLRAALGMQLGGALGNLIDRLRFGEVTDFLDLRYAGNNVWPVFNTADSAIVVGVGMLLFCLVLRDDERGE